MRVRVCICVCLCACVIWSVLLCSGICGRVSCRMGCCLVFQRSFLPYVHRSHPRCWSVLGCVVCACFVRHACSFNNLFFPLLVTATTAPTQLVLRCTRRSARPSRSCPLNLQLRRNDISLSLCRTSISLALRFFGLSIDGPPPPPPLPKPSFPYFV